MSWGEAGRLGYEEISRIMRAWEDNVINQMLGTDEQIKTAEEETISIRKSKVSVEESRVRAHTLEYQEEITSQKERSLT